MLNRERVANRAKNDIPGISKNGFNTSTQKKRNVIHGCNRFSFDFESVRSVCTAITVVRVNREGDEGGQEKLGRVVILNVPSS